MIKEKHVFWGTRFVQAYLMFTLNIFRYRRIAIDSYVSFYSRNYSRRNTSIGKRVEIWGSVIIWTGSDVEIGNYSQVNPGTFISGKVSIGNYVMIGPNVNIIGGTHNFSDIKKPMRFQGGNDLKIVIENNVWIGAGTTILGGVTIGEGAIIGAGSVVKKNILPGEIVAGVPTQLIRRRS